MSEEFVVFSLLIFLNIWLGWHFCIAPAVLDVQKKKLHGLLDAWPEDKKLDEGADFFHTVEFFAHNLNYFTLYGFLREVLIDLIIMKIPITTPNQAVKKSRKEAQMAESMDIGAYWMRANRAVFNALVFSSMLLTCMFCLIAFFSLFIRPLYKYLFECLVSINWGAFIHPRHGHKTA